MNNKTTSGDVGYYSYSEISKILGISPERVRNIERAAINKIKHPRNIQTLHVLKEYLVDLQSKSSNSTHADLNKEKR